MPNYVKKTVKTEEVLHLELGIGNKTLTEAHEMLNKRMVELIKRHGPDAKLELLYKNNLYNLYVTVPEHLESDREYNERIFKETKQGK